MSTATAWIALAGNAVVLIGVLVGAARWFRRWFSRTVVEPIRRLQQDNLTAQQNASHALEMAQRVNDRLDRHLEGHT